MTEDLSKGSEIESGADAVATEAMTSDVLLSGAEGAETLIGQATVPVAAPAAGAVVSLPVQAGQHYVIDFDPSAAQIRVAGDDLVLTFANGGQIVFQGIGAIDPALEAPIFEIAGTDVPASVIYQQAVALSGPATTPEGAPTLETAAGPAGAQPAEAGTGETRYDDDTGQTIPLLNKEGVIPGVERDFGLIELENRTPLEEPEEAAPTPPAVKLVHDETAGVQNANDDGVDDENDVDPPLPPALEAIHNKLCGLYGDDYYQTYYEEFSSDSLQAMGTIPVGGDETIALDPVVDGTPSGLFTGGTDSPQEVLLFNFDSNVIVGLSSSEEVVFIVYLDDATGDVWFVQCQPINHDNPGNPDEAGPEAGTGFADEVLNLSFTVTGPNGSLSSPLVIEVQDDGPVAVADTNGGPEVGDTNLILIFDRSGSMDDNPNVNGFSDRIDLARAAIANLLNAVGPDGLLNIMIVDFAGSASTSGWLTTVAEANAYLASLQPDGTTNYGAAIDLAMTAFDPGMGAPTTGNNITYFLSDGKPNPASTGLDAGAQSTWENFLTAHDMPAFAVGIGSGVTEANLAPIAYDPNNTVDPQIPPILVTNEGELILALLSTSGNVFSGNVLANDNPGTDGYGPAAIVQLALNGAQTTGFAAAFDIALVSAAGVFLMTGSILGVDYWVLSLNESTGDYQLDLLRPLPHTVEGGIGNLVFDYTIVDGDGDQASATLSFDITDVTNAGDGLPLIVETTPNANGSDVLDGTDLAEILAGDHGNDELNGGGGNDQLYGGNGADVLDGGDGDDILIGGAGSDELYGDAGDDVLNGGSGNDLLDGGVGNDTLYGGAGDDDLLGFDGDDDLFGDNGDDFLVGEDGDDFLNGGTGDDYLFGGDGNDILFGGGGDDVLDGGMGDDDLYGSDYMGLTNGDVTFYYYSADEGHDYIIGFDDAGGSQDIIDLSDVFVDSGGEFLNFTQLLTQGYLVLDSSSDVAGNLGVNDTVIGIDLDGSVGIGAAVILATVLDTTLTSTDSANFIV